MLSSSPAYGTRKDYSGIIRILLGLLGSLELLGLLRILGLLGLLGLGYYGFRIMTAKAEPQA